MKVMDTGAVTINMATKTKITIDTVTKIMTGRVTATKSTAIKAMGMGMGTMTAITRLCMAGTRAIAETCRLVSKRGIDCRLAWNGNWNFVARCRPV
jgi:hypothetical protein